MAARSQGQNGGWKRFQTILSGKTDDHGDVIKWKLFSALLAICAGNLPGTGEFPAQRPVTRSFDVVFDLHLDKWLSKQSWGWWFETPLCPLWRHCNANIPNDDVMTWEHCATGYLSRECITHRLFPTQRASNADIFNDFFVISLNNLLNNIPYKLCETPWHSYDATVTNISATELSITCLGSISQTLIDKSNSKNSRY